MQRLHLIHTTVCLLMDVDGQHPALGGMIERQCGSICNIHLCRILSNGISPERHAVVDRLSNRPLMSRFSIDPRYPYACAAAAAMIGGLVLMSLGHSFRSWESSQSCIMSGEHGASAALSRLWLHVCVDQIASHNFIQFGGLFWSFGH